MSEQIQSISQIKFFEMVDQLPVARRFWDRNTLLMDRELIEVNMPFLSEEASLFVRFLVCVWSGKDESFSVVEVARLIARYRVVAAWFESPFWP